MTSCIIDTLLLTQHHVLAKKIRFIHGRKYKFFCNKCGAKREGVYFREGYDARARLICGHHRNLGYTLPPDYLEDMGYMMKGEQAYKETIDEEGLDIEQRQELIKRNNKLITRKSIYY